MPTDPALLPVKKGLTDPLALYIHWPFCVSKCPYCDFNSHVRESVDQTAWRDALIADLRHEASVFDIRPISSIFFGGGTPSLMPPATVAALIDEAARLWGFTPDVEITLEANPSSVEAARFADLADAGINRVSLGLQALDDAVLRFLGRAHGVAEGLAALAVAQRHFGRVSFDLIYALPGQTPADWAADLERAIGFGTGHLSLYQLTIEPGTRFATEFAAGRLEPLDSDAAADLFDATRAITESAGIPAYEVSNHARAGQQSRHNLSYWRYDDYLGVGPGAHGRRGGVATVRRKKPENWLNAVTRNGHGTERDDLLAPEERAAEALLMGLRLDEGVDLSRISARSGIAEAALIDAGRAAALARQGLIRLDDSRVRVLPAGMLLLDRILAEIVAV